ncbi:MAG: glycosyltransferase family 39 protein [Candidatus Brocadiaceae bacterium]|uniref:ArnT family glycosyltransferase n=1 Tax=Candidatus Wunengus sp. YC61 TaxID=3367698 RepID=UPI00271F99FD|nr:glycosyltransferase family 39 protein [Candidatus Brocadiaceae bacterium]
MLKNFRERQLHFLDLLILAAVSAFVIFPALGQNRHWASREIRHAEIIREMAESGDYLVPKLLGKTYYDKPPVMHVAAAILIRIVGEPSMTLVRMPSAIAGILGILVTYGVGLLLLDRKTALIGAFALLGMPGYSLMARQARPDMILCFSIIASCLFLCLGMRKYRRIPRMLYFTLAGLLAGLGVVTKGPFGILFPVFFAILVPFRRQDLKRPRIGWIIFGFGVLAAIALWAVPAYFRDGGVYLHRVIFQPDLDVSKGGNGGPFYYVWMVLLLALPLSLFLPVAIVDLRRRGYSAMLAVAGAIFIVISCIPQKRRHYLLPLYPFLALEIAASIVRHSKTSKLVRRSAWVLIPLSVIAIPTYYAIVQPLAHPDEDPDMLFAKEVLSVVEQDARIYCAKSEEEMAWVGRQHKRIYKLPIDSSASKVLRHAESKSYLVIDEHGLTALLKITEPLPIELIFTRKIDHEKSMLFRVKEHSFDVP